MKLNDKTKRVLRADVKRGGKLFDKKEGPGWWNRVSIVKLDMTDGSVCMVGQLRGEYYNHISELLECGEFDFECRHTQASKYGLEAPPAYTYSFVPEPAQSKMLKRLHIAIAEYNDPYLDAVYRYLTRAWQDEIRERRAKEKAKTLKKG